MKTIRNLKKRQGFTLVELLIVIIIIGILAGAMMMVAGSGTDRAEATKIISDLRTVKAASLMLYADNNAWPVAGTKANESLSSYMDRTLIDEYVIRRGDAGAGADSLFVGRIQVPRKGIMDALKKSAIDSGLYYGTDDWGPVNSPDQWPDPSANQSVWVLITR